MQQNVNMGNINQNILNETTDIIKRILKDNLIRIVLFGSYARGDYNNFSDIDVFVLVNSKKEELSNILNKIVDKLFDLDLKYNITINPLIENLEVFNKYKDSSLLFENIEKEGVVLYG